MRPDAVATYLKIALIGFGIVFCCVYPLSIVWPSGWQWHGGEGAREHTHAARARTDGRSARRG